MCGGNRQFISNFMQSQIVGYFCKIKLNEQNTRLVGRWPTIYTSIYSKFIFQKLNVVDRIMIIPFGFICMWFDFSLIGQFPHEHRILNLNNLCSKMKVIYSHLGQ